MRLTPGSKSLVKPFMAPCPILSLIQWEKSCTVVDPISMGKDLDADEDLKIFQFSNVDIQNTLRSTI